jgi:endonuclease/exonuclease/phosphatase family metal-dependent hydrolase
MSVRPLAFVLLLGLPTLALAVDVPLAGKQLDLRARGPVAGKRTARIVLADPALAAPLPDPTLGAALILNAGAADGQCRAEIALDPANWRAIGGDGPNKGWRYQVAAPGTQGVRRIVVRPGLLTVTARGAGWPCDLQAATQRLPASVVLRVGAQRYCAAFGAPARRNEQGRLAVRDAAAPAGCPETDVTLANLNLLHGLFCPGSTMRCRLADRVDLLFQHLVAVGCPDFVTLQEIWPPAVPLIEAKLAATCPFPYSSLYIPATVDDEMILTRYPIVDFEQRYLLLDFRRVLFARVDHPIGPVDLFVTHLASGSDMAQSPCGPDCPSECVTAGAATVRQCQGVQMANFIEERHDVATPALAAGDFNESPGTFVYDQFVGRGWTDTYLAAGNPECDPDTGVGCTSGRIDNNLTHLESPVANVDERIDYIFLIPPGAGSLCGAAIDTGADADGDGTATRIFADDPNPFAPICGPAPDPICWPSDHEGAQLDLNCG